MIQIKHYSTNLQNTEVWETEYFRYINIHKVGSSTVRKGISESFDSPPKEEAPDKVVTWTVLRDPYLRFIDAIAYDIGYVGQIVNQEAVLDRLQGANISEYIFGLSNPIFRGRGTVRHSMPQVSYLLDMNLDIYVDIKDLSMFCSMHFPGVDFSKGGENLGVSEDRDVVAEVLDSHPLLKQKVLDF